MSWKFSLAIWVLTLVVILLAAENKVPQLSLLKEARSSSNDNVPQISVRFPNGKWDKLVLNRYYASHEYERSWKSKDTENCRFIGRLSEETEACVAMTGCPASAGSSLDEAVEITILSENVVDTFKYKWYSQNGSVIPIEDPFRTEAAESGNFQEDENQNELELEGDLEYYRRSAPNSLIKVQMHYDRGFLRKFNWSHKKAKQYMIDTQVHIKTHFCHKSLGTKLHVQFVGQLKYHKHLDLHANGQDIRRLAYDTPGAVSTYPDLNVFFAHDDREKDRGIGIALRDTLCSNNYKRRVSISEWQEDVSAMASIISHEMAHSMGMRDIPNNTYACYGEGLMSYGPSRPAVWSECSKKRFQEFYQEKKKQKNWCLKRYRWACHDVTKQNQAENDCNYNFIGDGLCDDKCNFEEYEFDQGDCCNNTNADWNSECEECECKVKINIDPCQEDHIGDGYCHDECNDSAHNFDGGDCCRIDVFDYDYDWFGFCEECKCKEKPICQESKIGDGYCHDECNVFAHNFDGRDCCAGIDYDLDTKLDWNKYCNSCTCVFDVNHVKCNEVCNPFDNNTDPWECYSCHRDNP